MAQQGKNPDYIHQELLKPDNVYESIKNPKQAQYFAQKIARQQRGFKTCKSIADEIAIVQHMHQTKKYEKWLKHVHWNSEKHLPLVVMYTDEFITDIAASSRGPNPIVLGIDKTFEVNKFLIILLFNSFSYFEGLLAHHTVRKSKIVSNNSIFRKTRTDATFGSWCQSLLWFASFALFCK